MTNFDTERTAIGRFELLNNEDWHEAVPLRMEENTALGIPSSIIFGDLNYFKSVNDTYGHYEGDRVIEEVKVIVAGLASVLRTGTDRRALNSTDISFSTGNGPERRNVGDRRNIVAKLGDIATHRDLDEDVPTRIDAIAGRVGGDEFAIYAATDQVGAGAIEARLRKTFGEKYLELPENLNLKDLNLGISVGSATLGEGMTPKDVLDAADLAMRTDKKAQSTNFNKEQLAAINLVVQILDCVHVKIGDVHNLLR